MLLWQTNTCTFMNTFSHTILLLTNALRCTLCLVKRTQYTIHKFIDMHLLTVPCNAPMCNTHRSRVAMCPAMHRCATHTGHVSQCALQCTDVQHTQVTCRNVSYNAPMCNTHRSRDANSRVECKFCVTVYRSRQLSSLDCTLLWPTGCQYQSI